MQKNYYCTVIFHNLLLTQKFMYIVHFRYKNEYYTLWPDPAIYYNSGKKGADLKKFLFCGMLFIWFNKFISFSHIEPEVITNYLITLHILLSINWSLLYLLLISPPCTVTGLWCDAHHNFYNIMLKIYQSLMLFSFFFLTKIFTKKKNCK